MKYVNNLAIVTCLLFAISGCANFILVDIKPKNPTTLSDIEVKEVLAHIEAISREHGLRFSPGWLYKSEEDRKNWIMVFPDRTTQRYLSLAVYSRQDSVTHGAIVLLHVGISKEDGRILVLIRDGGGLSKNDFTEALEKSVVKSFSANFPSYNIKIIKDSVVNPLGP